MVDLLGGFNPVEKYARQNGNLPQIGVKIKNIETTTQWILELAGDISLRC